jgi:hypothetical protein
MPRLLLGVFIVISWPALAQLNGPEPGAYYYPYSINDSTRVELQGACSDEHYLGDYIDYVIDLNESLYCNAQTITPQMRAEFISLFLPLMGKEAVKKLRFVEVRCYYGDSLFRSQPGAVHFGFTCALDLDTGLHYLFSAFTTSAGLFLNPADVPCCFSKGGPAVVLLPCEVYRLALQDKYLKSPSEYDIDLHYDTLKKLFFYALDDQRIFNRRGRPYRRHLTVDAVSGKVIARRKWKVIRCMCCYDW